MTRKLLTKKQLYGYSCMKWKKLLDNLLDFSQEISAKCAFCFDSRYAKSGCEKNCNICQVGKTLCDENGTEGLFSEIDQAESTLYNLIDKMCMKLGQRYYDEK